MKILLFGGSGQLGLEIIARARDLDFETVSPVISEIDISEQAQVRFLASKVKPNLIINCAAYTAVDKAEDEKKEAYRINAEGAANVALAAKDTGSRLIHISTDYVFDGTATAPIPESAPTNPLNVYGASKLQGEQEVTRILEGKGLIVRTSSLHGKHGANFVHTMLGLFKEHRTVRVVNDQWMSPTWAGWLAEAVLDLGRLRCEGIVHACCSGVITWFDFASEILDLAFPAESGGKRSVIEPQVSDELKRPAIRPRYSAFDCTRLTALLQRPPIPWQKGIREHLRELGALRKELV